MADTSFYRDKRVLITGHTGFKGSWLSHVLLHLGASVAGYALAPAGTPNLFDRAGLDSKIHSVIGDIRDIDRLRGVFEGAAPEIVIHMAAQPLVLASYEDPRYTYEVNVMGTVNLLECVRRARGVKSVVHVTTDKVYKNREWDRGYRETDVLDGDEPYANSKSCSELVTACYRRCFLSGVPVSTVRAGNVIGGGDFAENRILPDCYRALSAREPVAVRNPSSVRPYQHVLEPLFVYLTVAQYQYENPGCAGEYNVGPDDGDMITTGDLAGLFCGAWGDGAAWKDVSTGRAAKEAALLRLDSAKLKAAFGWRPRWGIKAAVERAVKIYKAFSRGKPDVSADMLEQIREYQKGDIE
jgi:CDP-glucose 4,6-dehydratase